MNVLLCWMLQPMVFAYPQAAYADRLNRIWYENAMGFATHPLAHAF